MGRMSTTNARAILTFALTFCCHHPHPPTQAGAAAATTPAGANLSDILSPEMVGPLLDNADFVAALLPHLPEGEATIAGLRANVNSPQYSQALQALNSALDSGDLAGSMGQFGVDPADVAAGGGGVLGLAAAIQKANPPAEE
jgi:hypothetical protein